MGELYGFEVQCQGSGALFIRRSEEEFVRVTSVPFGGTTCSWASLAGRVPFRSALLLVCYSFASCLGINIVWVCLTDFSQWNRGSPSTGLPTSIVADGCCLSEYLREGLWRSRQVSNSNGLKPSPFKSGSQRRSPFVPCCLKPRMAS